MSSEQTVAPWGLSRMRPYPRSVVVPTTLELDAERQIAVYRGPDGRLVPVLDKHKASETSNETDVTTSGDGQDWDQGSDQEGDSD
ncbi:putative ATP-grasp-modified RiPP [Streptomyces sp. NPDC003077]|uniref:putative ATP-grasp-modified RiPP n=1 Tax=Streptomyces sp. NPDC003077 TaxID=3154443 RepID=UPI0033B1D6B3